MGGMAGGGGDGVGHGRLRLGMLGVHDAPVAGVLLDPGDDTVHHGHRLHRVRAGRRLGRKHQGIRPVVDSRGHVGGLGPRRGRGVDHGVQHLGGHHHRLAGGAAGADDPLLQAGHVFRRHLDPQIAARHHHGVGQLDDLVQALDRRRLLQLGQDGGAAGHQRARLGHVLGALDKGKSDPIHAQTKAEVEVAAVLLGKRRQRQHHAGHVDALVVRYLAAGHNLGVHAIIVLVADAEFDPAVVDQDFRPGPKHREYLRVG